MLKNDLMFVFQVKSDHSIVFNLLLSFLCQSISSLVRGIGLIIAPVIGLIFYVCFLADWFYTIDCFGWGSGSKLDGLCVKVIALPRRYVPCIVD